MATLENVLAARRIETRKAKKVHPAATEFFGEYELGALAQVDFERGSRYDIFYKGGKAPGSKEYLKKHGTQRAMSRTELEKPTSPVIERGERITPEGGVRKEPGYDLHGKPEVEQSFLEGLLDDYDRWKKTGSRFPTIETAAMKRKRYMGKRFTGNSQGFSGASGGAATAKKQLLG